MTAEGETSYLGNTHILLNQAHAMSRISRRLNPMYYDLWDLTSWCLQPRNRIACRVQLTWKGDWGNFGVPILAIAILHAVMEQLLASKLIQNAFLFVAS
jgi:hypothetical protein